MIKKIFKGLFTLVLLLNIFTNINVKAATVNIPDVNLKKCLNSRLGLGESTSDISSAQISSLKTINCNNKNIADLTGLEYATNVTKLSLHSNQITDLSKLSQLNNLLELSLNNNDITDISSLSGLSKLRLLNLDNNNISSVTDLSGLTTLRYLYLGNNEIDDISSLSNLIYVQEMFLQGNHLTDISAVANFLNLRNFSIDSNDVSDISPLSTKTSIRELYMSDNNIKDISAVSNLTNLRVLYMSENQIDDATAISTLSNLYAGGMFHQTIFRHPLYIDAELPEYPERIEKITLDDGTVVDVTQTYNEITKSYEGFFNEKIYNDLGTFSGKIISPVLITSNSTDAQFFSTSYTVDERYAPTSEEELLKVFNTKAFDPSLDEEITSSIVINTLDGYDFANPQVGTYNIVYSVVGSNSIKVYSGETLTVNAKEAINQYEVSHQLISDSDNNMEVNLNEKLTYQLTVKNLNEVDVLNPVIMVNLNEVHLIVELISNINSNGLTVNVVDDELYIYPTMFRAGEEINITYDIYSKDKWYLNNQLDRLDKFYTTTRILFEDEENNYLDSSIIYDGAFSIGRSLEYLDSNKDLTLTEGEEISIINEYINVSPYTVKKHIFDPNFTDDRLIYHNDFTIESNKRELVKGIDYEVLADNKILLYEFVPNEVVKHQATFTAKDTFSNDDDLLIQSFHYAYMLDQTTIAYTGDIELTIGVEITNTVDIEDTDDNEDKEDELVSTGTTNTFLPILLVLIMLYGLRKLSFK